ncbi:uncharacterized protein LOC124166704 isoform X2 [Ischnura elegans]|uniref:uncharacterized protein LOC124166704 isoform X2 n=1 Tax=Ischnura elegans TaxID=197161 RepID=UPI001ED88A4C|nr:uncharacterized protein LOC124166704 isoform X2 [Ischnura elegans]
MLIGATFIFIVSLRCAKFSDEMDVDDSSEWRANDVREKLTLHVKRRISSGGYDAKDDKCSEAISGEEESLQLTAKKKSGKAKKKKSPKQPKKAKVKVEDPGTEELSEDRCSSLEPTGGTSTITTSAEGEEFTSTGTEDTTPPGTATPLKDSPELSLQMKNSNDSSHSPEDSFLNNKILNEILNERKRALLESMEVLEFLGKKIKKMKSSLSDVNGRI